MTTITAESAKVALRSVLVPAPVKMEDRVKALTISVLLALAAVSIPLSAETIEGRWKLTAAEDLRADGSVARYPWGEHPVGWIVVDGGFLYTRLDVGPRAANDSDPAGRQAFTSERESARPDSRATGTEQDRLGTRAGRKLSRLGVPVFMADVKGDVAGLAWRDASTTRFGSALPRPAPKATGEGSRSSSGISTAAQVIQSDHHQRNGSHPAPGACSELNDTQSGVLDIVFKLADDKVCCRGPRRSPRSAGVRGRDGRVSSQYRLVSAQSIAAIQRGNSSRSTAGRTSSASRRSMTDLMRTISPAAASSASGGRPAGAEAALLDVPALASPALRTCRW